MNSDIQPDVTHSWDIVQLEDGVNAVQVAQYPPLVISREPEGQFYSARPKFVPFLFNTNAAQLKMYF